MFSFESGLKPLESPFHENQFQFAPSMPTPSTSQSTLLSGNSGKSSHGMYKHITSSMNSLNGTAAPVTGGLLPGAAVEFEVDPLYNKTSQRKRDSLKLKRNMK
ncbi:unnamed protein product [Ambrosiozyma monospora]|uniref:Unnamed protein product n=1 Tax=Ambrosiozyma monospora TaxID=43982 RepID=A0ACB5T3Y0_AMBMO|nr:unnamed protein product [Ambrosiozyma monospora]